MITSSRVRLLIACLFSCIVSLSVHAQDECDRTKYLEGDEITSQNVLEVFTGSVYCESDTMGARTLPQVLAVQLNFPFGKASLTTESKEILNQIGRALQDPAISSERFDLVGHTDAVGKADYNQVLSERRADSVKNYLVGNFAVHPRRLRSEGRGETELYITDDPSHARNRRVEISMR